MRLQVAIPSQVHWPSFFPVINTWKPALEQFQFQLS